MYSKKKNEIRKYYPDDISEKRTKVVTNKGNYVKNKIDRDEVRLIAKKLKSEKNYNIMIK